MKTYVIFYIDGNTEARAVGVLYTTHNITEKTAVKTWAKKQSKHLADLSCYYAVETELTVA